MLEQKLKQIISLRYEILPTGIILNRKTGKPVKFHKDQKGYLRIRLYCPEISKHIEGRKTFKLHRLVALFHLSNYSNNLQVNHINGIKDDNQYLNLEMVTARENVLHAWNKLNSDNRKKKLNLMRDSKGRFMTLIDNI